MDFVMSPTDFVTVFNQTIEYAYPSVVIEGELSNFTVRRNQWVYFDLKDETSSVKFFGTVYSLPGPLEDGLIVRVVGQPRLSPQYGFSISFQTIAPVGEGSLNKAAQLLQAKLEAEGLFAIERKRSLPYPPHHIGLVASKESAAYADFIKVLNGRWGSVSVTHVDVKVQGDQAPDEIAKAIEKLNAHTELPDVIVVTRGGGSADDLAAFSTEQVTRAVAVSRVPTVVAVGHEVDLSLAELAADMRASTPSNAAELLVPDRKSETDYIRQASSQMYEAVAGLAKYQRRELKSIEQQLSEVMSDFFQKERRVLGSQNELLGALDPAAILRRGFSVVRLGGKPVVASGQVASGDSVRIQFADGNANATINEVE